MVSNNPTSSTEADVVAEGTAEVVVVKMQAQGRWRHDLWKVEAQ